MAIFNSYVKLPEGNRFECGSGYSIVHASKKMFRSQFSKNKTPVARNETSPLWLMDNLLPFCQILSHTAMVLRIAATAPQESRRWAAVLSCGQSAKYAGEPSKHPTSSTSVLADVDFAEPADLCTHSLGYWRCFHLYLRNLHMIII